MRLALRYCITDMALLHTSHSPASVIGSGLYALRLSVRKTRISSMHVVGMASFTVALSTLQVVFLLTGRRCS